MENEFQEAEPKMAEHKIEAVRSQRYKSAIISLNIRWKVTNMDENEPTSRLSSNSIKGELLKSGNFG